MGLEAFPEIENFQKLPRQVIVKGGNSTFTDQGAELRGIVINNIGHPIRDLKVQVVILDDKGIPIMSAGVTPDPESLPQGGISAFTLEIKNYSQKISDYYLYSNWKFDDRE